MMFALSTWGAVFLFFSLWPLAFLWDWWRTGGSPFESQSFEELYEENKAWQRKQNQLEAAKQRKILKRNEAAELKRIKTLTKARALKEGSDARDGRASSSSTGRNEDRWSSDEYADYMGLRTDHEEHNRQMFLAEEESDRVWDDISADVQEDYDSDNWYYDDNGNYHEG
jgi:hypothetical protein